MALVLVASCKHSLIPTAPEPASRQALLVLPGFGYGRSSEKSFQRAAALLGRAGVDLYVANYVARSGLAESRKRLLEFYRTRHLDRYERVHVFAFIAGAWTLNPALNSGALPNVRSVVYDRSPLQERAPRIAVERLRIPARIRYGQVLFDVAKTPYVPVARDSLRVGIMVESRPTGFIRRYAKRARSYGPIDFDCASLQQRFDDCAYVALNHDELYTHFDALVPELLAFVRNGRFSDAATRTPPAGVPLQDR